MLKETPVTSLLNAGFVIVVLGTLVSVLAAGTIWQYDLLTMFASVVISSTAFSIIASLWLRRSLVQPLAQLSELADMVTAYRHQRSIHFTSPLPEIRAMSDALEASRTVFAAEATMLKRDRDSFEAILAALEEGVLALDAKGVITRVNPAASTILGISGQAIGQRLEDVARLPALFALHAETMSTRQIQRSEIPAYRGKVLSLVAVPLLGADHTQESVVLVIHDLTELRRLEQVRTDFVANVSHELKTPLTSITGYVETLLDGAIDDVTVRDSFLRKISANSLRLKNLANDLLTLARLESADEESEAAAFAPNQRVRAAANALEDKARGQEISFEVNVSGKGPELLGDGNAYEQAVYNLIDNAINYTPSGGTITVSAITSASDHRLSVRDTGIGIPQSEQARIFERFYRVDKVRSRELSGTGLGLAIVRHVANAQGGEVMLESRAGEGSTFTLICPLPNPAASDPA